MTDTATPAPDRFRPGAILVVPTTFKRARIMSVRELSPFSTEFVCAPIDGTDPVTFTVSEDGPVPELRDGSLEFLLTCIGTPHANGFFRTIDADDEAHARALHGAAFPDEDVVRLTTIDQWALIEGGLVEDCSDGVASVDMDMIHDNILDSDWLVGAEHALAVLKHFRLSAYVDELEPHVRALRPHFGHPAGSVSQEFDSTGLVGFVVLSGGLVADSSENVATIDIDFLDAGGDDEIENAAYVAERAARFGLTRVVDDINTWLCSTE